MGGGGGRALAQRSRFSTAAARWTGAVAAGDKRRRGALPPFHPECFDTGYGLRIDHERLERSRGSQQRGRLFFPVVYLQSCAGGHGNILRECGSSHPILLVPYERNA